MDKNDQDFELEDDEMEVEEAHDPANAEAQSVASVQKADDGKNVRAPKRKGDKVNNENPEKLNNTVPGQPDKPKVARDNGAQPKEDFDFEEDLEALMNEEATLSEEFKAKTAVIFEAAINSKLREEVDRLEEQYEAQLDEELGEIRDELIEKVDGYLNYVVETWMAENELAVQNGLRTEIAEDFMNRLKDLFVESYVEVPESKVDLVDDLAEQVEELDEKLNAAIGDNISLSEELEEYKRTAIIAEHSDDLADTEIEKLQSLVADMDFVDEETFASKVKTVKESYFKKKTAKVNDLSEEVTEDADAPASLDESSSMGRYVSAIRRQTASQ